MRLFTLYVGSNGNDRPSQDELTAMISEGFESFTMLPGHGMFRGGSEEVWLVKVACDDAPRVLHLADRIRARFDQNGVGIEHGGHYFRCTKEDKASGLPLLLDE